jgi:hypothetical protein
MERDGSATAHLCNAIAQFYCRPNLAGGPRTICQVRLAISAARRPAFVESNTITRLRSGYRVVSAKNRSSSIWPADKILACLPLMCSIAESEHDSRAGSVECKRRFAAQELNRFLLKAHPFQNGVVSRVDQ